jgi:periplasmic protein TonB
MGYQALLFCPDEKTARVVTQVLSELEFSAQACTEPFAAVKKLMGEHFDAIVVDCDNEQNATLLFKSARNSTSNQASLAVAVVEGQAGVAKAFRIGANLVLTKPINVEQAKGTLRVARGLLRKGDPAKGVSASSSPSSSPAATPTAPTRTAPPENVTPRLGAPNQLARPFPSHAEPPTVAAQMMAASSAIDDDEDVIDVNQPAAAPTASANGAAASSSLKPISRPEWTSVPASYAGTAAGSAAAPARSAQKVAAEYPASSSASAVFERASDPGKIESSGVMPAPTFSFGGANEIEKPAGSKKVLIGVAAAALIAAGLYLGLTQFHGKPSSPKETPTESATAPKETAAPKVPVATTPSKPAADLSPASSSAPTQPTARPSLEQLMDEPAAESNSRYPDKPEAVKGIGKPSASASAAPVKSSADEEPAPRPIVVKNGTTISPVHQPSAAPDAAAPSALDIAPSASGGSLSNLLANPSDSSKPVLETLNVSQGVSQGLLIKKVQPTYPPAALRLHVEGAVQLLATIGKSGNITAVKIISGEPVLAQSAVDAVKQWKYKPYYLNGDPVEIQTQVTINFKLPK